MIAQVDTAALSKIDAFTKFIDSLSANDNGREIVSNTIEEGTLTQEIVSTPVVGLNKKGDKVRRTRHGGFGKYTTHNMKGDTVYKILYHDNINKNFYESFYFKDNKLVYAKIDYQENGIGNTFYFRKEYYNENEILFVNESPKSISDEFRQRVTYSLKEKGNGYLKKFLVNGK